MAPAQEAGAEAGSVELAAAPEQAESRTPAEAGAAKTAQAEPKAATATAEAKPAEAPAGDAEAALAAVKEQPKPEGQDAVAASPPGQVLENGGPILTAGTMPAPVEPKKKSFLSSFFGSTPAEAKPAPVEATKALARETKAKPVITLPDANEAKRKEEAAVRLASLGAQDNDGDFDFPGVRKTNLFEIKRKSGIDDDSDIDVYEDIGSYEVASAAGLARLAPNGLLKQRDTVDTACLKPKLVRMLKQIESHFGKKLVVTSGYRSPTYNKKVRGAEKSQHMYCAAVDVQMPGVHKFELARYARAMNGRGGVGTYCHSSIHIDIGPERDWNWKCGGKKT